MAIEYREVSQALLDANAGKYGQIPLKNGGFTSLYFDLGSLISHPKEFGIVADAYADQVLSLSNRPDVLIDVPKRITPLVTAIMERTHIPFISPQLESKDHGISSPFYGEWEPGQKGLVIDDVVTSGGSIIDVVLHCRNHKLLVEEGLVLIKRQQKGLDALEEIDVNLRYIFDIPFLASDWRVHGGMTDQQFLAVQKEFHL